MTHSPRTPKPIDDEESALMEAIDGDDYDPSGLSDERLEALRAAARNTISEPSIKVSIRLAATDLARLKARALLEGVPYQTLIKSILHRSVSG
ncbi:hypothetical protein DXV76_04740 [Rhodobacteraceae bacterium CCMM004]|nr:hypothetical protein DXV76_04740 [Rhodobacteraceae bacterium CCMM004]